MEITWYGLSCFRLTERGLASVVTDPFKNVVGLPQTKLKADVVTISHDAPGHNYLDTVQGYTYALTRPGEYEIQGVMITGIATMQNLDERPNVLYMFDFGGVTVAHLGDMNQVPPQNQIEALERVDVLLVPVGGGRSLNAAQAAELVSMIEPSLVVPMHFQLPGLKLDLDGVERFLNEMGVTEVEQESRLRVTTSLLAEETSVVLLQPRGLE